jgi:hypothetical protein
LLRVVDVLGDEALSVELLAFLELNFQGSPGFGGSGNKRGGPHFGGRLCVHFGFEARFFGELGLLFLFELFLLRPRALGDSEALLVMLNGA